MTMSEITPPASSSSPPPSGFQVSRRTLVGVGLMVMVVMAAVWEASRYGITDRPPTSVTSTSIRATPAAATTAATTVPQQGTVRFSDSFARANSATDLGSDDLGHQWQVDGGAWGIDDEMAYISRVSETPAQFSLATAHVDDTDGVWSATVVGSGVCGLVVRYVDPQNFLVVKRVPLYDLWNIEEVTDGESVRLGYLADPGDGPVQVIIGYRGSSITVSVGGAVHQPLTTALDPSTGAFGLFGEGVTARECRWQDATLARAGS